MTSSIKITIGEGDEYTVYTYRDISEEDYEDFIKKSRKVKNDKEEKTNKKQAMSDNKVVYTRWLKRGKNTFIPADNSKTVNQLDAGLYSIRRSDSIGWYFFKKDVHLDELLEFPSGIHKQVLDSVKHFWTRRDKFKEYGFAFKRGILLHGSPGTGKSCIINLAIKYLIEELKGIVLNLGGIGELEAYSQVVPEILRVIEPTRPIIVVLEDLENYTDSTNAESTLLNVLDGLDQMENVIYLGTTNYIEKLKARIINRPSRFDRRIVVPHLNYEDRLFYFNNKLKPHDIETHDIQQWARDTELMSIAHLSELVKSVIILGNTYEEAIQILKELQDYKKLHSMNYDKETSPIGVQFGTVNMKEAAVGMKTTAQDKPYSEVKGAEATANKPQGPLFLGTGRKASVTFEQWRDRDGKVVTYVQNSEDQDRLQKICPSYDVRLKRKS